MYYAATQQVAELPGKASLSATNDTLKTFLECFILAAA
jgi:hypothetical protein